MRPKPPRKPGNDKPRIKRMRSPSRDRAREQSVPISDSKWLQYRVQATRGVCDLVIGLDFGTSSTKTIVQAPYLLDSPSFVVNHDGIADSRTPSLLPSVLWVSPDGACSLAPNRRDGVMINNIKVGLFSADKPLLSHARLPEGLSAESVATAYLALVIRLVRKWTLSVKRAVLEGFELRWALNLGIPSASTANTEENRRFRMVGMAAWKLSMTADISVDSAKRAYAELDQSDGAAWQEDPDCTACEFTTIPEIVAAAIGYARSKTRRDGLHIIFDVGASTVDVCGFALSQRDGSDKYSLLTSDVQQCGTLRLHLERILATNRALKNHIKQLVGDHNPLDPPIGDLAAYSAPLADVEACLQPYKDFCECVLRGSIFALRTKKASRDTCWKEDSSVPLILAGGGSRAGFFTSVVKAVDEFLKSYQGNKGLTQLDVPIPKNLGCKQDENARLAVAWGLSHPKLDIGSVTPIDEIEGVPLDVRPPDLGLGFVSKDQV